jgi:hypothetical protein
MIIALLAALIPCFVLHGWYLWNQKGPRTKLLTLEDRPHLFHGHGK